uniref:Secapin-2 n=1 Tax=Camponotus floridanus TaxID=104421 RepID=K7NBR8_CAMFO|nr:secapin-2 [Camponotus floridanus]
MKLLLAVAFVIALFFLSLSSAYNSNKSQKEKIFLPFKDKIEQGSIINTPPVCPRGQVKVGSGCRTLF